MSTDLIGSTPWMRSRSRALRPRTVVNAARLIYVGAALDLATVITIVATAGSIEAPVLSNHPAI